MIHSRWRGRVNFCEVPCQPISEIFLSCITYKTNLRLYSDLPKILYHWPIFAGDKLSIRDG